ncbi:MAG: DUF58 domain-containing protein [Candidatus Brocadiaceae bacterium]|nr:DUF58 domain-containing protein [Candidatus Brocadiaceae bacterium]
MGNIERYLRPEVIRTVARLDLKARFIVEGFFSGLHASPYHGFSTEFSEHREYTFGDEPRLIDWKVFARTDKHYVKRFEAETNLNCHMLLDVSESMAYGSGGGLSKLDYAICMAAALGYMLIHQQDNVGLVTFDEDVTNLVPARSRRSHLAALLGVLAGALRHRPSRLAHSLHRSAGMLSRRGLVIVLSDLIPSEHEEPDDVLDGLRHLRHRGHDVICFQLLDHAEVRFPFHGPVHFMDVESLRTVRTDADAVAAGYRREVEAFVRKCRDACRHERIDFLQVDTEDSFDRVLLAFLRARQSRF